MRKKPFLKSLGFVILFICLILVYLVVYFFPALIEINRSRREVKNIGLRIQDLEQEKVEITFPDKKEKQILENSDRRYRERFPLLGSKQDIQDYYRALTFQVKKIAEETGVLHLAMSRTKTDPDMVISSDFGKGSDFLSKIQRKFKKQYEMDSPVSPISADGEGAYLSGNRICSCRFFLTFAAPVRSAAEMMIRLADFPFQIEFREIRIQAGEATPIVHVVLNGYCQMKEGVLTDRLPGTENGWIPVTRKELGSSTGYIDRHSPLLMKPVYHYFSFDGVPKHLPVFGTPSIFVKKR
jgi:hypothetical protein